eukprot:TRINITY_DN30630_c0_g1_i1.p1 TRINITY_DN30630_c0_g1~~TRINITY_DN30630_c0_g1_i1.p1  ORF type:complete len:1048 (+),score=345.13 TRINITY_DN30630_c0_g1_i1:86-3145(+)
MALAKRIAEIQKAKPQAVRQQHVQILKAFVDHGKGASSKEWIDGLMKLRETRDRTVKESSGPRQAGVTRLLLQQWTKDIEEHPGVGALRQHLLAPEFVGKLEGPDISRVYNQLKRLNLQKDADEMWATMKERMSNGQMNSVQELLGVWSVAPKSRLSDLDAPLMKALRRDEGVRSRELLSLLTRSTDMPTSKAVQHTAEKLSGMVNDLSSLDLAYISQQLGRKLSEDFAEHPRLRELMRSAKQELVARGGTLEVTNLVNLLGAVEGNEDPLWQMLREQLLAKLKVPLKEAEALSAMQALEIYKAFINLEAAKAEIRFVSKRLEYMLGKEANPALVGTLSSNLEYVLWSKGLLEVLFNTAVRLREDLYPTVLWSLFKRAAETNVVNIQPNILARLQQIGDRLERHGVGKQKMTLADMTSAAEAMRGNGVVLPKCLGQMSQQFLDVYAEARKGDAGSEGDSEAAAAAAASEAASKKASEAGAETAPPKKEAEAAAAAESAAEKEAEAGDAAVEKKKGEESEESAPAMSFVLKTGSGEDYVQQVQRLMISFWVRTGHLKMQNERVTDTILRFLKDRDTCRIRPKDFMPLLAEVSALQSEEAKKVHEGLLEQLHARLSELPDDSLVEMVDAASSSEETRGKLLSEVGRRLAQLPAASDASEVPTSAKRVDELNGLLERWSRWSWSTDGAAARDEGDTAQEEEDASDDGFCADAADAVTAALPSALQEAGSQGHRRLTSSASALSTLLAANAERPLRTDILRRCLHTCVPAGEAPTDAGAASELAFAFASLHGGMLPFDTSARLWHSTASALSSSASRRPAAEGPVSSASRQAFATMNEQQQAKLWAFGLAARHLSTRPTLVSLQLQPGAPRVEAALEELNTYQRQARLWLSKERRSVEVAGALKELLPEAIHMGHCEAGFVVPGTPYQADFGFEAKKLLLLVARPEHRGPGRCRLSGQGLLLQRTLGAMGWRVAWLWPEEWEKRLHKGDAASLPANKRDAAVEALRALLQPPAAMATTAAAES